MLSRIWRVFYSTLAAFFGVQSDKNRQQDFQATSVVPYLIMGIVLAILLVISLLLLVNQIVS